MRRVRTGPGGPKRSKAGVRGTNKGTRAPRGSSGSPGGKMTARLNKSASSTKDQRR